MNPGDTPSLVRPDPFVRIVTWFHDNLFHSEFFRSAPAMSLSLLCELAKSNSAGRGSLPSESLPCLHLPGYSGFLIAMLSGVITARGRFTASYFLPYPSTPPNEDEAMKFQ